MARFSNNFTQGLANPSYLNGLFNAAESAGNLPTRLKKKKELELIRGMTPVERADYLVQNAETKEELILAQNQKQTSLANAGRQSIDTMEPLLRQANTVAEVDRISRAMMSTASQTGISVSEISQLAAQQKALIAGKNISALENNLSKLNTGNTELDDAAIGNFDQVLREQYKTLADAKRQLGQSSGNSAGQSGSSSSGNSFDPGDPTSNLRKNRHLQALNGVLTAITTNISDDEMLSIENKERLLIEKAKTFGEKAGLTIEEVNLQIQNAVKARTTKQLAVYTNEQQLNNIKIEKDNKALLEQASQSANPIAFIDTLNISEVRKSNLIKQLKDMAEARQALEEIYSKGELTQEIKEFFSNPKMLELIPEAEGVVRQYKSASTEAEQKRLGAILVKLHNGYQKEQGERRRSEEADKEWADNIVRTLSAPTFKYLDLNTRERLDDDYNMVSVNDPRITIASPDTDLGFFNLGQERTTYGVLEDIRDSDSEEDKELYEKIVNHVAYQYGLNRNVDPFVAVSNALEKYDQDISKNDVVENEIKRLEMYQAKTNEALNNTATTMYGKPFDKLDSGKKYAVEQELVRQVESNQLDMQQVYETAEQSVAETPGR